MSYYLLARRNTKSIAIIGAGVQSRLQLRSLGYFRGFSTVFVYDIDSEKARSFVNEMKQECKASMKICKTVEEAVNNSDNIISATWAIEPFLFSNMVKKEYLLQH
ncbi:hypothetical protein GMD78_20100 [Ornithinibacillus sp. L9]|uniref:Ornithine cyclodeaminase n=1 Tax=Ornithinibacillus caprae TaxID=2678566 RepID=A0A6N8FN72_9BACI|nr:hypothetical protein [Ornithinibacillus caprae]